MLTLRPDQWRVFVNDARKKFLIRALPIAKQDERLAHLPPPQLEHLLHEAVELAATHAIVGDSRVLRLAVLMHHTIISTKYVSVLDKYVSGLDKYVSVPNIYVPWKAC